MAVTKKFECESCGAIGKIVLQGDDYEYSDIVGCPICGADITEDDIIDDSDE